MGWMGSSSLSSCSSVVLDSGFADQNLRLLSPRLSVRSLLWLSGVSFLG